MLEFVDIFVVKEPRKDTKRHEKENVKINGKLNGLLMGIDVNILTYNCHIMVHLIILYFLLLCAFVTLCCKNSWQL
jgi:hypothetical protein